LLAQQALDVRVTLAAGEAHLQPRRLRLALRARLERGRVKLRHASTTFAASGVTAVSVSNTSNRSSNATRNAATTASNVGGLSSMHASDVTLASAMPHATIASNHVRSVFTFNARPCR